MRLPMPAALFFALLVLRVPDTHAQASHGWLAGASVGILHQDVPSSSLGSSNGVSAIAHVGRKLGEVASVVGEIAWLFTPENDNVVFVPVAPGDGFGGGFLGPTALRHRRQDSVATSPSTLRAYLTAGPSLAWVARRESGARAVAVGGQTAPARASGGCPNGVRGGGDLPRVLDQRADRALDDSGHVRHRVDEPIARIPGDARPGGSSPVAARRRRRRVCSHSREANRVEHRRPRLLDMTVYVLNGSNASGSASRAGSPSRSSSFQRT